MVHWRRAWTLITVVIAVAVIGAFGLAVPAPGTGRAPRVAAEPVLTLVQMKCSTGQLQAGEGCFDAPVAGQGAWEAGQSTTTWGYPDAGGSEWQISYRYSVPADVPSTGAKLQFSLTANANSASGAAVQECVSTESGFAVKESGDPCAKAYAMTAHSSASGSKGLTLLPPAGSSTVFLVIDFGDGHHLHFKYKAQSAPAPGRCGQPSAAGDPTAHGAAINEVHVVCAKPDCQFHKGGTPADAWLPAETGTVLKALDEVSCDPDGALTLAFADNSTVVVSNTTQLKIGSFFTEGGIVRTEILLKMGEIAAKVNKSEATKSDFRIKPPSEDELRGARDASALPTGLAVSPGTLVRAFYDPGSKTELVSVLHGSATLTPKNPLLPIVTLHTGREVELTHTYESPAAPIGKAGARGGIDALTARDLVLAVVAKHNRVCKTTTPRDNAYSIAPARAGWLVSVKLIGRLSGTTTWNVTGRRVTAANAAARKLTRSCR